tara:strand:+ start:88 stop:582 length:495 start_codon:yes stop_codon:yes gene_type:complete
MRLKKKIFIFVFSLTILLFIQTQSYSKIVGNKIILGSALSITGKYSSDTKSLIDNNNEIIKKINEKNGIKVSGRIYLLDIIYYDNKSNETRANQLLKRLIQNEGINFLIGPQNFEISDEVKNLINENQLVIVSSYDALEVYIDAFKTIDSVDSKKIREYIGYNK